MQTYQIGDIVLRIDDTPYPLATSKLSEPFRKLDGSAQDIVDLAIKHAALEELTDDPVSLQSSGYAVYQKGRHRYLVKRWATCRYATAVALEEEPTVCWLDHSMVKQPKMNIVNFFGAVCLHRIFLCHNAAILHASYINWKGQAVLFTAPSGTGKSTQAELWAKYAGAEIVNGDRVLVRQRDGRWYAFGYPCCGSSKICLNRTLPLRAIVVLRQGKENRVEQLTAPQKIRALATATEVYPWDSQEVDRALDIAAQLAGNVTVMRLTCRPDEEAVETLKQDLEGQYAADI